MTPEEIFNLRQAMLFGTSDVWESRVLTYFMFAEAWGWRPSDVDELDWKTVMALKVLLNEFYKEKERMTRKERKGYGL